MMLMSPIAILTACTVALGSGAAPVMAAVAGAEAATAQTEGDAETETASSVEVPPPLLVESPRPPPSPPPAPRSDTSASRRGQGLLISGVIVTAVGGASLVLVAMPAAIIKTVALDRARRDPVFALSDRETRYRRARIADDTMEGAFWTGLGLVAIGVPLLVTGAVIRSRASRRVASRLQVDPSGVAVRF